MFGGHEQRNGSLVDLGLHLDIFLLISQLQCVQNISLLFINIVRTATKPPVSLKITLTWPMLMLAKGLFLCLQVFVDLASGYMRVKILLKYSKYKT